MTKPMTHLEAFCSNDAKRGREWKDGDGSMYRRDGVFLEVYNTIKGRWETYARQAAATDWQVTWADEPKALTPQEALRALADGECVACKSSGRIFRMTFGGFQYWRLDDKRWSDTGISGRLSGFVVPDPSQPAELAKPPLKVGDRVKVRGRGDAVHEIWAVYPSGRVNLLSDDDDETAIFGPDDIEKIEEAAPAEPQVEFPLSYAEARQAESEGCVVDYDKTGTRWRIVTDGGNAK